MGSSFLRIWNGGVYIEEKVGTGDWLCEIVLE